MLLKDSNLRRYWFELPGHLGVGVTAFSVTDAETLARAACVAVGWSFQPTAALEEVDVRNLDQNHVVPNMGPVNFRGVWYPLMNL